MQEFCIIKGMLEHPLETAIDACGGSTLFRERVGISLRTLASWRKEGVPDVRWPEVAAASGGSVTVQDLALERACRLGRRSGISVQSSAEPEPA
jgi:hypothetical protein